MAKEFAELTDAKQEQQARVLILRNTNVGLLFLHLYQMERKSLPTTGTIFPSPTRLSIPPLPWRKREFEEQEGYDNFKEELGRRINGVDNENHHLVFAASKPEVYGLATAAAQLFRDLETSHNCIWIDMNDIHDVDELFEAFREAAFHRLHDADWTPLFQIAKQTDRPHAPDQPSPLVSEILRIINSSNQPWVFFINAREIPGSNRTPTMLPERPNGWMDKPDPAAPPDADSAEAFRNLMQAFVKANSGPNDNRIVTVMLCFAGEKSKSHLLETLQNTAWGPNPAAFSICPPLETKGEWKHRTEQVLSDVVGWTSQADSEVEHVARRHFIQTLASMQRPRHFSVAWARCVNSAWHLRSPFDAHRLKWLEELEDFQIVRRMDGGFIWLQTSFRQALRRLLSLTPNQIMAGCQEVNDLRGRWNLTASTLETLREWNAPSRQADIHLSLSTWYRKVLDSTGVATAVFEIVDHLCWAAECLVLYGRDRLMPGLDAASLASRYVETARQLLAEHQFLIQTQGHPEATLRRLEFIRDLWGTESAGNTGKSFIQSLIDFGIDQAWFEAKKEGKVLDNEEKQSRDGRDLLRSISKLQCTAAECSGLVNREVAEDGDAFANLREWGLRMVRNVPLTQDDVEGQLDRLKHSLHQEISSVFDSEAQCQHQVTSQPPHFAKVKDRRYEWIQWWRYCAMLGNTSRSFDPASSAIRRALDSALHDADHAFGYQSLGSLESFSYDEQFQELPEQLQQCSKDEELKHQLQALHSMEVAAFNLTIRAHTNKRALVMDVKISGDPILLDKAAFNYATKGLELVESIQNSGMSLIDHDFLLHWLKARLLMIAGIASISADKEVAGSSRHAMTFLGDAAACLNSTMPERAHADLAIVELRRAEVCVSEAAAHPFDAQDISFERWTFKQLEDSHDQNLVAWQKIHDQRRPERIRTIRALLSDALHYLERAEPILKLRRRNVFWTTWFFERRLRAISLLIWTSAFDDDSLAPIPYLGLEAAMYGTETEPDRLLLDALRMIRVDAYRMSMVVMTYASCVRALHLRLLQAKHVESTIVGEDANSERVRARARGRHDDLQDRLASMYENLEKGRQEIDIALENRKPKERKGWHPTREELRSENEQLDGLKNAELDSVAREIVEKTKNLLKQMMPGFVTV